MRVLLLLSLVACAAAQFNFFNIPGTRSRPRQQQQQQQRRPQQQRTRQQFRGPQQQNLQTGGAVDDRLGSSEYHFSWRHDGSRTYTGQQAFSYCSRLGGGWSPVSINDGAEDGFINRVIQGERQEYIWTGGSKRGNSWSWADGSGLRNINWSNTGGARRSQPDNREGNESCLAILNNFYGDGVKWHDVACSHRKPTICEKRA